MGRETIDMFALIIITWTSHTIIIIMDRTWTGTWRHATIMDMDMDMDMVEYAIARWSMDMVEYAIRVADHRFTRPSPRPTEGPPFPPERPRTARAGPSSRWPSALWSS